MELVQADTLLAARRHEEDGLQSEVHLDVTLLEDGADLDDEGLLAGIALVNANAGTLALELAAAAWTDGAVRPDAHLDVAIGGGLVVKVAIGKEEDRLISRC